MTARDTDLVITQRPDGTHYRLPDHERLYLLGPWVALSVGCCLIGFVTQSGVGIVLGAVLFFALIFLCGPLEWYLFKGHTEVLLTADVLHLARKAGPFWWRYAVPRADVRRVILFSSAGPVRLVVDCKERWVPLSCGEPLELLRRLQEDLCRRGGIARLTVEEELLVRRPGPNGWRYSAYVLDGRLVVRDWHAWGCIVGSVPVDELERITAVVSSLSPSQYYALVALWGPNFSELTTGEYRGIVNLGRQVAEVCERCSGRPVPFVEEHEEPLEERLLQPVYSALAVEWRKDRVIFWPPYGPELVVVRDVLRIMRSGVFWDTKTVLHASQVRTVLPRTWTTTHAESGTGYTEYGIFIDTVRAEPVTVKLAGVGRKDCEWLATVLRQLLLGERHTEIGRLWSAAREPGAPRSTHIARGRSSVRDPSHGP